jgi:chromosome segregation ATPase
MAEPHIVDLGDTVVFEFYDGTEDNSHTRITFKRKKNGELTAQGVKIQEGVGNIRGSKTFENFVASQEKLKENKEEENPLISGLKKVNQLLKGMQDEKKSESSKVTIVEPKKVQKVSKDEKELARINEDIAFAEGTIEQNLVDIENKEEELQNEKGHRDYDVKELQQKIAELRKKKMPKDEKEDEIESIRYDIEERKDDYDVMYEEEMANIKEMKAENKKLEKKLITLKLKQEDYASKIKLEQEQESPKQDDKPKRERTKSTRKQTEEPKTDSGDSDISGKKGKKITDINAKFVEVSELYEKVRSAKNQTEKTTANRKLSALLNLNPTVKYIFENMNELQKQLGDRLKKNSFCP